MGAGNEPAVAIGVIVAADGRVLIDQRPPEVIGGGLWEFPGGKVEAGESPETALSRELAEEVGITPTVAEPLITLPPVDDGPRLHIWRVTAWDGEITSREGQPLRWVTAGELPDYPMPAANAAVITSLRLPDELAISPEPGAGLETFLEGLAATAAATGLVQLRAPGLDQAAYAVLAEAAVARVAAVGGRLLLNAEPELAREVGAAGVHLNSRRLARMEERPANLAWVGASCHSAADLARAEEVGADFALLSPVAPTASHPGTEPLGWAGFGRLVAGARLPVYALGGVGPGDRAAAVAAGARGLAGIRAFWQGAA
ncbi:8-oxo-dGTPase [Thiohalospira halophila DSM 15071]|uniref:8-oxo-dGTP diphosphatase n=1 Tax=Thiohalospira halophila DSM 15071 TaxID=1123397 RepID=A0A1I1QRQ3_9GAMM|nr:Nudix family hydrolase [Thiohalospira halophila]SFD24715.1 8-oxo-dGTPase [Thiohalospira halophila DSM 15071]